MVDTTLSVASPADTLAEAASLGTKLMRSVKLLNELRDEDVTIAATPKDEVWHLDKVTLHHFRPMAEKRVATPALICYGLVGRWTMTDLQEDRSLVQNLLKLGVDLYTVDWGNPSRADRFLTLDDYINSYLDECMQTIRERAGVDKINLIGVCEGGVFAACYAALHPEMVKNGMSKQASLALLL